MATVRLNINARNNVLLSRREKMGLTQVEMAAYCDVPLHVYSGAERLEEINGKDISKICTNLELEPAVVFPSWLPPLGEVINKRKNYFELDDKQAMNILGAGYQTQHLLSEDFKKDFDKALKGIGERGEIVLKKYFGIGCEPLTLGKIATEMGLSRERVRQIKEKSLMRLRHHSRKDLLREYLSINETDNIIQE